MIQPRSIVKIADNSGGTTGRIFKVLGGSKRRYAELGDEVVLSIQTAQPRKAVKKKDIYRAVVVRQKKAFRRKDGSYIRFDENAVVEKRYLPRRGSETEESIPPQGRFLHQV